MGEYLKYVYRVYSVGVVKVRIRYALLNEVFPSFEAKSSNQEFPRLLFINIV
jgi:hypothetical protein